MRYVIDAHAWINYLIGNDIGKKIASIIENAENEIFTDIITISEVISVIKRENRDYEEAYNVLVSLSKIYPITLDFAKETGLLHAELKKRIKDFGLADSFILLTANKINAKVITGDEHFKSFKNVLFMN